MQREDDEAAAAGPEATPIRKGLDFELLRKRRAQLSAKQKEQQEESTAPKEEEENGNDEQDEKRLEEALNEQQPADNEESIPFAPVDEPLKFNSVLAKNIHDFVTNKPPKNELFAPGRMAFVFELADEVGHYNDAYAVPTSLIRSRADKKAALDDLKQKTELVVSKISKIMSEQFAKDKKKQQEEQEKKKKKAAEAPPVVTFDGDIFADVGRDYELDEETLARASASAASTAASAGDQAATDTRKSDYFKGLDHQREEDVEMKAADIDMASLISQAAKQQDKQELAGEQQRPAKKPRFLQDEEMDVDANDIDMFGLGASALPTSFEERRRTVAYESGDEDEAATSMIDQGTHRNKKAQLSRWDFDDEEEWQKYKDSIEIMPKSASQYGVKMGDGRKRNRDQRRGMSDKQKLNREYQMIKNIMEKKYGTNI